MYVGDFSVATLHRNDSRLVYVGRKKGQGKNSVEFFPCPFFHSFFMKRVRHFDNHQEKESPFSYTTCC